MITVHINSREDLYKLIRFKEKFSMKVKGLILENGSWREVKEDEVESLWKSQMY